MDSAKNQLVDRLHSANNVLVTVSRDPSVDQLAACIGLTLILNKLDKHATAVFSGQVPSTLEFLQPEQTIEKNTDSLRDFIIALDKSKADKLRYKVEDQMVRIFITPYRTSINQNDLEFSQGDFNVDLVVGLGVQNQQDLDQAITSHGRILHDATVASIGIAAQSDLGSINWNEPQASSLSELVADLGRELGQGQPQGLLDGQIATALLTGIVAQTKRFSNERTSPQTMSVSAELLAAGANQQLVAAKLEEPQAPPVAPAPPAADAEEEDTEPAEETVRPDGTLEINHDDDRPESEPNVPSATEEALPEEDIEHDEPEPEPEPEPDFPEITGLKIQPPDDPEPPTPASLSPAPGPTSSFPVIDDEDDEDDKGGSSTEEGLPEVSKIMTEPPKLGGTLTANSKPEGYDDPAIDPLSMGSNLTLPSVEPNQSVYDHTAIEPTPPAPIQPPVLPDDSLPSVDTPPITPLTPPEPTIIRPEPAAPAPAPAPTFTPPPATWSPPAAPAPVSSDNNDDHQDDTVLPAFEDDQPTADDSQALSSTEESVESPDLPTPDVDEARDEVEKALIQSTPVAEPPIAALNAQPLGEPLHPASNPEPVIVEPTPAAPAPAPTSAVSDTFQEALAAATPPEPVAPPLPVNPVPPPISPVTPMPTPAPAPTFTPPPAPAPQPAVTDSTAPPPVPPPLQLPPIPYRFGSSTPPQGQ